MRDKVRKQEQHFPLHDFVYIASHLTWHAGNKFTKDDCPLGCSAV
jgi:hypothetical protein